MAKEAANQADIKNAKDAPEGANAPVAPVEKPKDKKLPKGELFIVKDLISGFLHSDPIPKAKAEAMLKQIEAKERREHASEREFDFQLVPYTTE